MTVGSRIKDYRTQEGLTQTELADKVKISKQTLYKYENDIITNIPSDKIEAIASVLNVTPAALMGWSSSSPSTSDMEKSCLNTGMGIKKRLNALLKERQMNANELASRINVTPSTIYSILQRDSSRLDISLIMKIARGLGVTADELLSDEIEEASRPMSCMTDDEQKKIFSQNLNRILNESSKSQAEVAKAIGVSQQTFNTWCRGIAIPRMRKIQLLADYFCVDMGILIESSPERSPRDAQLARLMAYWTLLSSEKKDALLDFAEYLNSKPK